MSNPLLALIEKYAGPRFAQHVAGIAADFWKDSPCEFPVIEVKIRGRTIKIPNMLKPIPLAEPQDVPAKMIRATAKVAAEASPLWHASAGELSEKMWGEANVLPAGDAVMTMLIQGLDLKGKNLVDLTAGLGGPMRKLVDQVGQIRGLESNPAIAARAMEIASRAGKAKAPIEAYDPVTFSMPNTFDCVIARELFYRIADKPKFFYNVAASLKPNGHLVFTDYIVDPENRQQQAVTAWQTQEPAAKPLGLIEMAEAWALVGFELKVSEDQTAFFRQELANGVNRYVAFLRGAPPADAETKKAILGEVGNWIHRLGAIQQGMKFYRFQASKT